MCCDCAELEEKYEPPMVIEDPKDEPRPGPSRGPREKPPQNQNQEKIQLQVNRPI